ncbi:non-hydrolyzing UDP-N-acetylglucosamine 2-epimerase [Methylobacter sp. BlB1]|uniref:non-hydrolyzing UDP-N-acetylglucosamine 2-epimerase n=1 Tax=Methylobacter sp. BlB1 TaxID=2785914 RepID=UPI001895F29A|nr:UDP-N-acetylglucosamine 2-epimerase (non-hydrolyzing) [Methylobacter sp. BlB1]MBF6650299.1 UDP-N-acetylglucosamine 2-epimerase (non-hydrolyzing) [Methylobacter sp. BlB1]
MKNKVAIILGTRPEAIKLIPIYLELKKSTNFEPILISTGQHASMLQQIFLFFSIKPDFELEVMTQNQTLPILTAKLFEELSLHFDKHKYDFVIVQGDTTTAFVGAVSALYYKYTIVHVEAGLRTHDKSAPFPEESNRKMIASVADIHFAATQMAVDNLYQENITKNVALVGNSVIDSLLIARQKIENNLGVYEKRFLDIIDPNKKLILVTAHRRESFGKGFEQICLALTTIAKEHPECQILYPVHLNPNLQSVVHSLLSDVDNIRLIAPLPYDDLVYLMSKSWLILTDSGGIQEEAPTFNVPLIVMRNTTEREEGLISGCSLLGGTDAKTILAQFYKVFNSQEVYYRMASAENPYGDGMTSKKIVDFLEKYFLKNKSQANL